MLSDYLSMMQEAKLIEEQAVSRLNPFEPYRGSQAA